jgi:MFS family permease
MSIVSRLTQARAFQSLRHREYRMLWLAQAFGTMGTWMNEVTLAWLMYELTDSVLQLGLVRGVQAIPYLVFSPLAGSAADRYSRKGQLMISQLCGVAFYAITAALVFSGNALPWHIYALSFLIATSSVFQQPPRASLVSESVPREYITNAIGLNSLMFNVSRGLGPAIAGVLIVVTGSGGAFAVQAAFVLVAVGFTIPLTPSRRIVPGPGQRESFIRSIVEGWKFGWKNETVRAALLCVMLTSFFIVPFTTLLPVFARDLLQVGATGQGLLLTGMGLGAFFSAFLVANSGHRMARGKVMLASGVMYGVGAILFAVSDSFVLSFAAMLIAGVFHVYCNVLVNTVVQTYSPPEFRGRTMAIFSQHQAVITLAAMVFGVLAELSGPRASIVIMATLGILSVIALNVAMPNARRIR